jgi:hypothetical protein
LSDHLINGLNLLFAAVCAAAAMPPLYREIRKVLPRWRRRAPGGEPRCLSEELDRCYCGSKAYGANSKSQSKGSPCRAHFSPLDFLALHFLVNTFDIGKHLLEAVSGAMYRPRPLATGIRFLHVHCVCSVSTSGTVKGRAQSDRGTKLVLRNTKGLLRSDRTGPA